MCVFFFLLLSLKKNKILLCFCLLQCRVSLSSFIFKKSLRVPAVKQGIASNLLNVDPDKVSNVCWGIVLLRDLVHSFLFLFCDFSF